MSEFRESKQCDQCKAVIRIIIQNPHRVEMTRIIWTCAECKFVNSK